MDDDAFNSYVDYIVSASNGQFSKSSEAVSYTHLDVYKRQAMGNTIGIVGGLIIGQAAVDANLVSPIVAVSYTHLDVYKRQEDVVLLSEDESDSDHDHDHEADTESDSDHDHDHEADAESDSAHDHDHGDENAHAWMSVPRYRTMVPFSYTHLDVYKRQSSLRESHRAVLQWSSTYSSQA